MKLILILTLLTTLFACGSTEENIYNTINIEIDNSQIILPNDADFKSFVKDSGGFDDAYQSEATNLGFYNYNDEIFPHRVHILSYDIIFKNKDGGIDIATSKSTKISCHKNLDKKMREAFIKAQIDNAKKTGHSYVLAKETKDKTNSYKEMFFYKRQHRVVNRFAMFLTKNHTFKKGNTIKSLFCYSLGLGGRNTLHKIMDGLVEQL